MKDLLSSLEGLGFSSLEIKIYLALLDFGAMSPYQIAKKIDISRSSIYNSLEHMVDKGMVEVIPDDTVMYVAQEPQVLLGKIESDYHRNIKNAKDGLEHYLSTRYEEKYAMLNGFDVIVEKVRKIIRDAKEEVFINTDIDLSILNEEMSDAIKEGVRIIVFSFVELFKEDCPLGVEVYSHMRKRTVDNTNNRLMIVADDEIALVADADNGRKNWRGTVTNNKLMKNIIREHIHNDIYMLKIRDMYGKEIYEKIHIGTKQEKKKF